MCTHVHDWFFSLFPVVILIVRYVVSTNFSGVFFCGPRGVRQPNRLGGDRLTTTNGEWRLRGNPAVVQAVAAHVTRVWCCMCVRGARRPPPKQDGRPGEFNARAAAAATKGRPPHTHARSPKDTQRAKIDHCSPSSPPVPLKPLLPHPLVTPSSVLSHPPLRTR